MSSFDVAQKDLKTLAAEAENIETSADRLEEIYANLVEIEASLISSYSRKISNSERETLKELFQAALASLFAHASFPFSRFILEDSTERTDDEILMILRSDYLTWWVSEAEKYELVKLFRMSSKVLGKHVRGQFVDYMFSRSYKIVRESIAPNFRPIADRAASFYRTNGYLAYGKMVDSLGDKFSIGIVPLRSLIDSIESTNTAPDRIGDTVLSMFNTLNAINDSVPMESAALAYLYAVSLCKRFDLTPPPKIYDTLM